LLDEIIDLLLDQDGFECDPINRLEGDTPLHSAVRWINSDPSAQGEDGPGMDLVDMMLESGSNPLEKNRAKLTARQLVDPANQALRDLIEEGEEAFRKQQYTDQNRSDFITVDEGTGVEGDEDAEYSGSDDEERAEWERRRRGKKAR
jgi:hypothetical protein